MSEPYLILHKVRGEPAFDIAHRMRCPICEGARQGLDDFSLFHCDSCADTDGYWWIVATGGFRAHPWQYWLVDRLMNHTKGDSNPWFINDIRDPMPDDALDCFACNDQPTCEEPYAVKADAIALLQGLGLVKKIERRV